MKFKPVDENDRKIRQKYTNKRDHAKARNIAFKLSFEGYKALMQLAGITVCQIGRASNDYHLARYGDNGPYDILNCRFITAYENHLEGQLTKVIHALPTGGGCKGNLVGSKHWNSKGKIVTPWGEFDSIGAAAKSESALFSKPHIHRLIKRNEPGYTTRLDNGRIAP